MLETKISFILDGVTTHMTQNMNILNDDCVYFVLRNLTYDRLHACRVCTTQLARCVARTERECACCRRVLKTRRRGRRCVTCNRHFSYRSVVPIGDFVNLSYREAILKDDKFFQELSVHLARSPETFCDRERNLIRLMNEMDLPTYYLILCMLV